MGVLKELVVGDDPGVWKEIGFAVEGDRCRVGHVDVIFDSSVGKGIRKWTLVGDGEGDIDGVPTTWSDQGLDATGTHPNGIFEIDHVVLTTPDVGRTVDALERLGVMSKRQRETGMYGSPAVQTFFRLGKPILELIGPQEPMGDTPARFYGLAFTSEDLELTAKVMGEVLHAPKDAVQPGRRIATLDNSAGSTIGIAIMSPHTKDEEVV